MDTRANDNSVEVKCIKTELTETTQTLLERFESAEKNQTHMIESRLARMASKFDQFHDTFTNILRNTEMHSVQNSEVLNK